MPGDVSTILVSDCLFGGDVRHSVRSRSLECRLLLSLSLSPSLSRELHCHASVVVARRGARARAREEKRREQDMRGEHKIIQDRSKDVEERTYVFVVYC